MTGFSWKAFRATMAIKRQARNQAAAPGMVYSGNMGSGIKAWARQVNRRQAAEVTHITDPEVIAHYNQLGNDPAFWVDQRAKYRDFRFLPSYLGRRYETWSLT